MISYIKHTLLAARRIVLAALPLMGFYLNSAAQEPRPDIRVSGKDTEKVVVYYDGTTENEHRTLKQLLLAYPDEDFEGGDQDKTKPCMFYISTDQFDRNGNNKVINYPAGDDEVVKEVLRNSKLVNEITRRRPNCLSFHVFIPTTITSFADFGPEKNTRHENDTIYMFADLYDTNGNRLLNGSYYVSWVRTTPEEPTGCPHEDVDTTDIETGRWKLADGLVLIKFDRTRVCRKCGHKIVEKGIERTIEVAEERKNGTHEHVWQYLPEETDFSTLKTEPSADKCYMRQSHIVTIRRQCLICGVQDEPKRLEDATILPNSNAPLDSECCPGGSYTEEVEEGATVMVGDRMKIDKTITTYFYCPDNGKKRVIDKRTETEWSEPCQHDYMLMATDDLGVSEKARHYHRSEFVDHYKCKKCGKTMEKIRSQECSHNYIARQLCSIVGPWKVNIKGVPVRLKPVFFDKDTTATYVAETETTQQLWMTVCPEDEHGWNVESTYPATNVTAEDVNDFISRLNALAASQGMPLRFRLPKAEEWASAYRQGADVAGWVGEYGSALHGVAELAANNIGVFDMKGNAAELCSDTTSIGDEGCKTLNNAVAGLSYADISTAFHPTEHHWMDMSEGKSNVGFRLFADPILGDDEQLELPKDAVEMRVGATTLTVGDVWMVRNMYQCETCGYIHYSPFAYRSKVWKGKKPLGCK